MITVNIADALKNFKDIEQVQDRIIDESYEYFRDITPIRSGNARRHTDLKGTNIVADYAYAERLDRGYSRQAPIGMTKPTQVKIQQLIKKYLGK